MGSQQLLLIVVGLIIIGIMIAVGMTMFSDQATSNNRDELANDLAHYAALARAYYRRPAVFGGGQNSFRGLTMNRITNKPQNDNGTYSLTPDPVGAGVDHVTLTGIGTQRGLDGTNVRVVMLVYADSVKVDEALTN
jgi:Tfp pilus assembly protein FimT